MKTILRNTAMLTLALSIGFFTSCKKEDEDEELKLEFKTGSGYTSSNATIASGTAVKIGVKGETEKAKDPIIKFNISESVNGGSNTTVYSKDLEDTEYEYDYNFTLSDTVSGNTHTYTFTITNRDGKNEQKSLTLTVQ